MNSLQLPILFAMLLPFASPLPNNKMTREERGIPKRENSVLLDTINAMKLVEAVMVVHFNIFLLLLQLLIILGPSAI